MDARKAMLQAHDSENAARRRAPLSEHAEDKALATPRSPSAAVLSGPALTSPGNMMALQRTVGNQVVQRLLQRDMAPEEEQDEDESTDTTAMSSSSPDSDAEQDEEDSDEG